MHWLSSVKVTWNVASKFAMSCLWKKLRRKRRRLDGKQWKEGSAWASSRGKEQGTRSRGRMDGPSLTLESKFALGDLQGSIIFTFTDKPKKVKQRYAYWFRG